MKIGKLPVIPIMDKNIYIKRNYQIQILNGKKFGTLLGELLKIIKVAEEDNADLKAEWIKALRRNNVLKVALDRRTPEGLKGRAL